MQHRRALAISVLLTLVIAVTVLVVRDQFLTADEADATDITAATEATATELPLVNLVRTDQGEVVVPAGSLDQQRTGEERESYDEEGDEEHEDAEHESSDEDHDKDHDEEDHD
jgi:hypothetical protein